MSYSAFSESGKLISNGELVDVAIEAKRYLLKHPKGSVLVFEDQTARQVEIDFRGTKGDVRDRLTAMSKSNLALAAVPAGPGRPKLGVVAREVTLLPSHWDWLALQPGGASVTLRKLVETAKKKCSSRDQVRQAQEAAYRFMTVMAGNRPNYEEALRALYAKDRAKFKNFMEDWPKDIRDHALSLAESTF